MPDVVFHALRFQEFRRTLYLNLMGKDDHGRHRGYVLYGFKIGNATEYRIHVGPGALVTPWGTRFYWDVPEGQVIDLTTEIEAEGPTPAVIAITADLDPTSVDPAQQPGIDSKENTEPVELKAHRVSYNIADNNSPALRYDALHPVEMNDIQETVTSGKVDNWRKYGAQSSAGAEAGALGTYSVVLGYVIVGRNSEGNPPAALWEQGAGWADGVIVVTAKNPSEALEDILGHDPLLNITGPRLSLPVQNMNAAYEQSHTNNYDGDGLTTKTPIVTPKYGTPDPNDGSSPWNVNWLNHYRPPSFMRDGEPLLWQLRRLDYYLRLWMNRTGSQQLVHWIQDGNETGLSYQTPLDVMLRKFRGTATNNLNDITYPDNQPDANAPIFNHTLKSGVLPHEIPQGDEHETPFGDSHFRALGYLNNGIKLFAELYGFDIPRPILRAGELPEEGNVPGGLQYDDGPSGLRSQGPIEIDDVSFIRRPQQPELSEDTLESPYFVFPSFKEAFEELSQRTSSGPSGNLLRNPHFYNTADLSSRDTASPRPGADSPPHTSFVGWETDASGGWSVEYRNNGFEGRGLLLNSIAAGQYLRQDIAIDLGTAVRSGSEMRLGSAAVTLGVNASDGDAILVRVTGRDSNNDPVFTVTSPPIGDTPLELEDYAFSWNFKDNAALDAVETLRFELVAAPDNSGPVNLKIGGLWLGLGMPPKSAQYTGLNDWFEFMSREGGLRSKMRGPTVLDNHDIVRGTDYAEESWTNDQGIGGGDATLSGGSADPGYPARNSFLMPVADDIIEKLAVGVGENLLINPRMVQATPGEVSESDVPATGNFSQVAHPVWGWTCSVTNPARAWNFTRTPPDWGIVFGCTLDSGDSISQTLAGPDIPGQLYSQAGIVSAAATLDTGGEDLKLVITGGSWTCEKEIRGDAGVRTHTITFRVPVNTDSNSVMVSLVSEAAEAAIQVYGISVNPGLPRPPAARLESEFLPITGSGRHPMLGPLYMGVDEATAQQIRWLADPTEPMDGVNQRTAFDIAVMVVQAILSGSWTDHVQERVSVSGWSQRTVDIATGVLFDPGTYNPDLGVLMYFSTHGDWFARWSGDICSSRSWRGTGMQMEFHYDESTPAASKLVITDFGASGVSANRAAAPQSNEVIADGNWYTVISYDSAPHRWVRYKIEHVNGVFEMSSRLGYQSCEFASMGGETSLSIGQGFKFSGGEIPMDATEIPVIPV